MEPHPAYAYKRQQDQIHTQRHVHLVYGHARLATERFQAYERYITKIVDYTKVSPHVASDLKAADATMVRRLLDDALNTQRTAAALSAVEREGRGLE